MSWFAKELTPMITPKAIIGTKIINNFFCKPDTENAAIEPAQRPIIKLPQYIEIYGAISAACKPPNAGCFNNSDKLL